ncbi:potassium channel family protein [Streptomyces bluensis]|uniref:potassium channel family protein n=1 Tax=Streptomyces bluensis TaxID=33897 RepID=UPI003334A26D
MSDPPTARTDPTRSGPAAHRWDRWDWWLRPGRRAGAACVARTVFITAGLVTAYYCVLPLGGRGTAGALTLFACGLLAVLLLFSWEVRVIVRSPHPRLRAVEALAATVALFLVVFASAYDLLSSSAPGSFSEPLTRTDALYFTLTVFSTVGLGDITPRSQTGRVVVMLQMAGGLLLVGVAARVLAGAVRAGLLRRAGEPSAEPGAATGPTTPDQPDREAGR